MSDYRPPREPETVGPLEQRYLDTALDGTLDDIINAGALIARAIDDRWYLVQVRTDHEQARTARKTDG